MEKIFSIDDEIEQILSMIENDKNILSKLSICELEIINHYLDEKKSYLKKIEGV